MNASPPKLPSEKKEDPVSPHPKSGATEQERVDEAMYESFPASDPPSWTAGVKHGEDELTQDSSQDS